MPTRDEDLVLNFDVVDGCTDVIRYWCGNNERVDVSGGEEEALQENVNAHIAKYPTCREVARVRNKP